MYKDLAKLAMFRLAESPGEAIEIAQYFISVDWHQEYIEKKRREDRNIQCYINEICSREMAGGGRCDECGEDRFTKLFYWPYASSNSNETFSGEYRLPRKHDGSNYSMEEAGKLMNELMERYDQAKREWKDSHWNVIYSWCYGRLCWKCFYAKEDYMRVPYPLRMYRCELCDRLMPYKSTYHVRTMKSIILCCIHCIEKAVEKQFATCSVCGKRTFNGLIGGVCIDCKIPDARKYQISSHLKRARDAGNLATLTVADWYNTVIHFNHNCAYCRYRPFQVLEHFLPITLGGGTTVENCVPACFSCNAKKGSQHPDELSPLDFIREHIDYIRQYLRSEKQRMKPLTTGRERALVIYQLD